MWACLAFAIAIIAQQVSLPIFRADELKTAAHILPFFGVFITWIVLALGFAFLLIRRQVTSITGRSLFLTFISGILGGFGLVILSYACDGSVDKSYPDPRPERLGVRQQLALSNVWVFLAWPLAYYLYPNAVGSNSIDTVILVMMQIGATVSFALGAVPSFIQFHQATAGGRHLMYMALWVVGIFSMWASRTMLWATTAKPRNWRDVITLTFYSTTLALFTVIAMIWIDLIPNLGYSQNLYDTVAHNWSVLATLKDHPSHLAAFILFIFATLISTVMPSKSYLVAVAPGISYVILSVGFWKIFPMDNTYALNFIFPALSLGFMAVCFWGFIESRIKWQADIIRGRFKMKRESPLRRAGLLSRLFFCWNIQLLKYGFQQQVQLQDVPDVITEETVESAYSRFRNAVRARGLRDSMLPIFAHTIGYQYLYSLLAFTVFLVCHLLTPGYLLPQILKRISPPIAFNPDHKPIPIIISLAHKHESYYFVLGLAAAAIIGALGYQHGWHWSMRCGIRARVAFIMAVYDKILTVRRLQSVGEVVNFLSSDSSRIIESIRFGWWLILAPISLFAIMGILIHYLGAISLVGMLVLFMQMPIQLFVGSKIGAVRERAVALTDERVMIMNDILSSIKTVKLYCWEDSFADQVAQIRAREGVELSSTATIKYLNVAISFFSPTLATMLSLALYYGAIKAEPVNSYKVFTVASLFNASAAPLACLPMAIANIAQGFIGMSRLQALMRQDDLRDTRILNMSRDPLVRVKSATFAFDYDTEKESQLTTADDHDSVSLRPSFVDDALSTFTLSRVNLNIERPGKLVAIVGKVGSGKSCFLAAIAGMLPALEGSVEVNGDISFLTQGGLLVNSTVRDNILFGLPYNEEHYQRTCEACELAADFKNLPEGDQTEVGEKGATLSGGQKARVGLARAVYADRPIYLLDDPLSAVDSRVGARIFEKCLKGALKNKIVVLVTNQPQYLPGCDEIIVLSNGRQVATGTYDQIKQEEEFASLLNIQADQGAKASSSDSSKPPAVDDPVILSDDEDKVDLPLSSSLDELNRATESQRSMQMMSPMSAHSSFKQTGGVDVFDKEIGTMDEDKPTASLVKDVAGSFKNMNVTSMVPVPAARADDDVRERATMMEDEDASSEGVGLSTFLYYCLASGTVAPILLAIFFVVVQLNRVTVDGYLSFLCYATPLNSPFSETWTIKNLLLLYAALVIVYLFLLMGRAAAFASVATASATAIHNVVFAKVLKAPLSFFESNPLGRILNRFSRDLDIVDGRLPDFFIDAFVFVVHCLSIIVVICAIIPWFTFLLALMCVAFWILITYYQRTARELKRLDAVSSSPIFAHLSVSIAGIATIRAYNAQERFRQDNKDKINTNTRVYFAFEAVTNWVGLCLDMLASAIATFVGLLTISGGSPDTAGFVLTYSLMMTAAFQYAVRTATETENLLVAVQRLKEYADNLTTEGLRDHYPRPPVDWPSAGKITFKDVVVKYRPELPPVLKRVNFTINPKEKVGIVGRTGAGKSTLIQVLFRLIEPAGGDILIDGVSTINMDLPDLRRKLACIPQDPVLFVGTIRSNLDPFNEHDDSDLWDALDRVHMKAMVEAMPDSISSNIVEGGINFSLGQRQLICIARAILRGARILVMDEATAAIDMESDQLIQNTVRSSFSDVTVLTIAHRLATIMDYDRIMVVADGGIAEFDSPKALLANPESIFHSMYHQH
jgi:ABC-type multidrug transport system fused ATPase/permease subunit